jgi:hypothetical protein
MAKSMKAPKPADSGALPEVLRAGTPDASTVVLTQIQKITCEWGAFLAFAFATTALGVWSLHGATSEPVIYSTTVLIAFSNTLALIASLKKAT